MLQENPFAKYAQPSQPAAEAPRPIFTAPKSPDKIAAEERARAAELRADDANRRASEAESRSREEFDRKQRQFDITGGVDTTESEKTAGFLTTRLLGAMRDIQEAQALDPSAAKPGALEIVAGVFGDEARNAAQSAERQRVSNAQLTALDSALTLGTGAAYTNEQLESYRASLFPRLTDDPATIRDKRRRLEREIQAGRVKAGASAPSIDKAIAAVDAIYGPFMGDDKKDGTTPPGVPVGSGAPPPSDTPGLPRARPVDTSGTAVEGFVPPEVERAVLSFVQQNQGNKNFTLEQYDQFLQSQGLPALNGPGLQAAQSFVQSVRAGTAVTNQGVQIYDPEFERLKEERDTGFNIDAAIRGFADVPTLGSADRMAAAGETLFGEGTYDQNLMQQRRISEADKQVNPIARFLGQFGGGLVLPGAGVKSVGGMAGLGAAYGGAYGFQSEYGNIGDRLASGLSGALTGGALGGLVGQGAKVYRERGAGGAAAAYGPKDTTPREVFNSAERIGVELMPADVGGTATGMATSLGRALPFSAPAIVSGARRVRDQAMRARQTVAEGIGTPQDTLEQAGEMATKGALDWRNTSRMSAQRKYDAAGEMAGDVRISPENSIAALDQNIAELAEIPGEVVGLPYLQSLRKQILDRGELTVNGIRGIRTQIRDKFRSDGLTGSDAERRAMMVADAAADDIAQSLDVQGKSAAASLFKRADMEWKERAQKLDEVIMPIIGKKGEKSGEQVMQALQAASRGNNRRFAEFIDALPVDERKDVSATLIANLGRSGPGAQNAAGDAFSLPVFLTHWNQLGPTAKKTILKGDAKRAMDDLARVAEGAKAASRFTNYSNTSLPVGGMATAATMFSDAFAFGGTAAGQFAFGKLLASPNVTKALVRIGRAKSAAARARGIASLNAIASREPALASDIMGLQNRLIEAFGQSPGRLAAQEENQ
jgi:hypothetical protein